MILNTDVSLGFKNKHPMKHPAPLDFKIKPTKYAIISRLSVPVFLSKFTKD